MFIGLIDPNRWPGSKKGGLRASFDRNLLYLVIALLVLIGVAVVMGLLAD